MRSFRPPAAPDNANSEADRLSKTDQVPSGSTGHVLFFINGPARLLMATILRDEFFPNQRATAVLLDQFNYSYDAQSSDVASAFDDVIYLTVPVKRNTVMSDLYLTYLWRNRYLRQLARSADTLVLFDIRSPIQKKLARYSKAAGNAVDIFAESIAVTRTLDPRQSESVPRRVFRQCFKAALKTPHIYDRFFVHIPGVFEGSEHSDKLLKLPPLLQLPTGRDCVERLLDGIDLGPYTGFDTVFFGQPLSNGDGLISRKEEEKLLLEMIGDQHVLVMPHPNEVLGNDNKYNVLPNAKLLPLGHPNILVLEKIRPQKTITYSSTLAIEYAILHPETRSDFYPVTERMLKMLGRYEPHFSKMNVHRTFVQG